ncbi:hypothetical protein D3P06_04470 [Paracoccus aestuarii]|uniref:Uncharacterized protein n=1 Tax=Paracoccus aestuarii TaxID=453842 RepID=A0A418ZZY8_9RHOB|nr:hypothetical protein D3P06_04470 [Paracoccus aestuarii]
MGSGADLRFVLLAAGRSRLAARLDGPGGPGPRIELSICDRSLTPADDQEFARSLMRHGLVR